MTDEKHRAIVDLYLHSVRWAWLRAEKGPKKDQDPTLDAGRFAALLRRAHVFELDAAGFVALDRAVNVYVTEQVGGVPFRPMKGNDPDQELTVPPEEVRQYGARIDAAAPDVPWPDRFPFDACYFALGTGIGLGAARMAHLRGIHTVRLFEGAMTPGSAPARSCDIWYAILATAEGDWFELYRDARGDTWGVGTHRAAGDDRWKRDSARLHVPWLATALLDAVNANDSLVERQPKSLADRLAARKTAKFVHKPVIPPPYYVVTMQPETVRDWRPKTPPRPRHWSHRWDVRGHRVTRVLRGAEPPGVRVLRRLERARYRVFGALNPPDSEAAAILMRHRIPPPRGAEWVAVLTSWRAPHVKGPADKPYVPSAHKPQRLDSGSRGR